MKKKNNSAILFGLVILTILGAIFVYQPVWQKFSSFRPWKLGLDLAGGTYLVYEIDLGQVANEDQESVVNGLRDVIEKRVNLFGVSEPRIYTEKVGDQNRLVAELAGIKDVDEAIKQIGETPLLDFREVVATASGTEALADFTPTALTGRYVKAARLNLDNVTRQPIVELEFNDEGGKIFADLTEKNVGQPLAIFLDNNLIEMPMVREKITGGKAQISGGFTLETARQLVERFNAGALPAPITLVQQQTIDAELGVNSLTNSLKAGLIGTLAVILLMVIFYRGLGVFASIALVIYIVLSLGIFKILPVTMSLAGIAGFLLSIGMAVDANILVFERMKEEIKRGLSRRAAMEEGFKRAWTSIRDSNISTLISSFVLYYFTSSFVRGFALTLLLGVLVSMFSAITVTRTLLRVFVRDRIEPEEKIHPVK
ncbi:MAG: protein translocase subunit SecD [bacterium]|nr:protein translocase subunit SecD [bacterium]